MHVLHVIGALLAGSLTVPAAAGVLAAALFGASRRRRDRPDGLVVHALSRRSRIDCSYVPVHVLDGFLASAAPCCWHTVREAVVIPATRSGDVLPVRVLTFDDGLEEIHTCGLPLLEKHGARATVFVVAGFIGKQSDAGDVHGRQRFLSAAQLREFARAGHEIGSHTMTHADLTMLDETAVRRELADSRHRLEDICGQAVTSLSFPFGSWNRRVWSLAEELGYRSATVLRPGQGAMPDGLIRVYGAYAFDSARDLVAKACGVRAPLTFARARVMSQFARGGPLWRFRPDYRLTLYGRSPARPHPDR